MISATNVINKMKGHGWDVDGTGDWDCVDLAKKADRLYHPGTTWSQTGIHGNAKDIFGNASGKYYTKIRNDHDNPSQLPKKGDIICFDATPKPGYTNKYPNPYGHVGIFVSSSGGKLTILMQASGTGRVAYLDTHSWRYRPCQGWLHPIDVSKAANTPKGDDNMPTLTTKTDLDFLYHTMLGREQRGDEGYDVYLNKDYKFVAQDLYDSKEAKQRRKAVALQLTSLNTKVAQQTTTIGKLKGQLDDAQKAFEQLMGKYNKAKSDAAKAIAKKVQLIENLQVQLAAKGEVPAQSITVRQAVQALIKAFRAWLSKK